MLPVAQTGKRLLGFKMQCATASEQFQTQELLDSTDKR